jgi:hypothetical protein
LLLQRAVSAGCYRRNECAGAVTLKRLLMAVGVACLISGAVAYTYAQSDDFCDTLTQVANEAKNKFRKFRGPRDEDRDFSSKVTLPGASSCYIDRTDYTFICRWDLNFSSDVKAEVETFASGIRKCYPRGTSSSSTLSERLTLNGVSFRVSGNNKRNRVYLMIDEDK